MMTGYEAFSLFHVLKLHFTSDSYDYFKYNGKCNISIETFERRRDKFHFYKLSRKYNHDDFRQFVISVLMHNENAWAGTLLEDESNEIHTKRMATIQSLSYTFKNDCAVIGESGDINSLLKTTGEYPELLTMALQKVISIETLCILNSFMNFLPMWERKINDDIRWPTVYRKLVKYERFIQFNRELYKIYALDELK
jgi:hypothetical protein